VCSLRRDLAATEKRLEALGRNGSTALGDSSATAELVFNCLSFFFLSDFESQEQQQQLIGSAIKRRRRFQSSSFLLKVKPVASLRIRGEREKKEPSLVA
jgi:hypothetical protein